MAVVILSVLSISAANLPGALNVLVIGSTHSYSEGEGSGAANRRAFNAAAAADSLRTILANDPKYKNTANVVFEDIFRTKTLPTAVGGGARMMTMEYRCYSLAQYYFWPDGRDKRLANLSGSGKTKWSHVVIVGDPYILANMPGVYAEGANLIADTVRKGAGKPILLMPWPEGESSDATAHFGQIIYRVGKGAKIPVAPAGYAWSTLAKKDESSRHPTTGGAYLAAACIYSEIFDRAATSSRKSEQSLAEHAFKTVKANKTKVQYTGRFEFKNPFAMKYVTRSSITFNHTGSSSENGIQGALIAAIKRCKVNCRKIGRGASGANAKIDFNYGRANTIFEPRKKYKVDPKRFGRSYGFPMQDHGKTAAETMLYGIDKRYMGGKRYDDGTDLGIAYDMIRQGEVASDIRAVPIRLMWAKLHDANPKLKPMRDSWHMSRYLDEATGTFMYTLLSGRRPVGAQPSAKGGEAWNRWLGQKIGYETAYRMAHLVSPPPNSRR
jgi:hypothetical protein